jgi:CO/xanthine dehydrogenase Mo-binding subunit
VDSGDVAAELAKAQNVVKAKYTYPFQMHGSVGTSCAVAEVKKASATLWSSTQAAYQTRDVAAMLLGLPPDSVRLIYTRGSGCYGLNGADAVTFDAAVLSQAAEAPVRLQYSRQDEMMWENLGNACVVEHRAAISPDGTITAWDRENWIPSLGSRPGYDKPGNVISGMLLGHEAEPLRPGPAKPPQGKLNNGSNTVPAYMAACIQGQCTGGGTVRSERVLTHTVRSPFFTGPLRSPLRIQNTFANECFMDELSVQAGADPLAFRLRHLQPGRLSAVVEAVAKAAQWETRSSPRSLAKIDGVARGQGVACVAYEGSNGYAAMIAEVEVNLRSGVVQPKRFIIALDCGPVSNPDGLRNQTEGGILQGMSRSLVEESLGTTGESHRRTGRLTRVFGSTTRSRRSRVCLSPLRMYRRWVRVRHRSQSPLQRSGMRFTTRPGHACGMFHSPQLAFWLLCAMLPVGKDREHEPIQTICFAAPGVRVISVFGVEGWCRSQVHQPGLREPGFGEPGRRGGRCSV